MKGRVFDVFVTCKFHRTVEVTAANAEEARDIVENQYPWEPVKASELSVHVDEVEDVTVYRVPGRGFCDG